MKQMVWCMVGVLVLASAAFAWAINQPTPPADNIYIKTGTASSVCESAQNMVGGQDLVLQLEIVKGSDIANFDGKNTMTLSVPFGQLDQKWCMNVKSPASATDVVVKASKRTETEGVVTFSTAQLATLHVIPSVAPVKEPVEEPAQGLENVSVVLAGEQAAVPVTPLLTNSNKALLYVLLAVGAVVVVGGIGVAYKTDVLTI